MVETLKHNKFIQNGYCAAIAVFELIEKKYKINSRLNELKEDTIGVSQLMYRDLTNIAQTMKFQYQKTGIPSYINYGISAVSEIKNDITLNPLSHKLDKRKFLIIGLTSMVLSITSLEIHSFYNDTTHQLNLFPFSMKLNLDHPESNPADKIANTLTKKNQPIYMTSIFKTKLEAFTNLLNITEGKSHYFYKDNLGVAIAYGWNPTKNSKDFNVEVAHKIGMSSAQVKEIEKISDNSKIKSVPKNLKKVILSDKQVKESAEYMMNFYEGEFLKVMKIKAENNGKDYNQILKAYHQLPTNQQAVMVHMAYKVGTPNLLKYNQFFNKLFIYMENPTNDNLQNVSDDFDYSFKTKKGERLHDTRVEVAHNDFFNECSITPEVKYDKQQVKERINSCKELVENKTIKLSNKG